MTTFRETLYDSVGQEYRVDKVYFEQRTDHQHLIIFHNAAVGRVMALDGIVQTTEADEFIYHEMLSHVPLIAHGSATDVLIIGGGDGGMLREVLKHPQVNVTQVEIDASVIDMAREHLPNHSQGAFDDPRATIEIADGAAFVKNTSRKFDVIICDSTDPIGPAEVLFEDAFYVGCREALKTGGVLVTQNGVPFFQMDEVITTYQRMNPVFADMAFYGAAVPTYVGGIMTFAWGSDDAALRQVSLDKLEARAQMLQGKVRYYNAAIHQASFVMPQYILDALAGRSGSLLP